IPTKTMIASAAVAHQARRAAEFGVRPSSSPAVKPVFVLTLTTQVEGNTVHATGTTNLPNGTKLSIGLQRTIFDPQEQNGPGYYDVDFAETQVRGGKYAYDLVDQRKHSAIEFADTYNQGEAPENFLRVGENVRVTVNFDPRSKGQSKTATEAAGGVDGSALETSPQRNRIGEWTKDPHWTLDVEREFPKPTP
ncbi:MAG: hypothetical protein INR62_07790, partial [Rhodospirillales bacterium]|nr:hypothetical protein [Acetobacter sp.]